MSVRVGFGQGTVISLHPVAAYPDTVSMVRRRTAVQFSGAESAEGNSPSCFISVATS